MNSVVKTRGKIYTPSYIVNNVCDFADYKEGNINKKHVIDNSCGDGAFLVEIVDRYIKDFLIKSNDKNELKSQLETYIHGIELDFDESEKCKNNMQKVASKYGLNNINFDVICGDSLKQKQFTNTMDFVLGNPPYVRVHNFGENYDDFKGFKFGQGGMADLYLIFYEIGINMLNKNGKLSYIAPSSFFTSLAGLNFRNWILTTNKVESICDLKHFQPFNATTYTAIVTIDNSKKIDVINYYEYDSTRRCPIFVDKLSTKDFCLDQNFYFSTKVNLNKLKKILNFFCLGSTISVKNGFATLADKVFIGNFDFDSKYVIDILKISTGKWTKCIYPYNSNGKLINISELEKDRNCFDYLLKNKDRLCDRDTEPTSSWYGFGRTQAINDVCKERIAINSLYCDKHDVKINLLPKGTGAYSGLYILCEFGIDEIKKALINNDFIDYVAMLGKYKSGGYYTCSSKDIKKYLDYYFYSKQ